jgi:hypothetical protein
MSDSITTAPNLAATSLFINACQLKNSNGAALNPLQVASGTWSGLKAAGVTTGAPDNLVGTWSRTPYHVSCVSGVTAQLRC